MLDMLPVAIADDLCRMHDRHRVAALPCRRVGPVDIGQASAHELHAAASQQADMDAVGPVPDVRLRPVRPWHIAREVVVRGPRATAVRPEPEAAVLLVGLDLAVGSHELVFLVHRALEVVRGDPVVLVVDAHPVGVVDPDLHGIERVDAIADQPLLLTHRGQTDGFTVIVAVDQVDPVRPDIRERIGLLDPLEGAGRDFQRLFENRPAVDRLADQMLDVVPDPHVVRVVPLVHVDADDPIRRLTGRDDPVGFVGEQAHRLLGDDVDAALERGEDHWCVQVVRRGDGHDVEIRMIPEDVDPRSLAVVLIRPVAGVAFEDICRALG